MNHVLAVGAHFDDVELGCGGALARHVAQGDTVTILVATHSGYRAPSGKVVRSAEEALAEGRAAAAALGVSNLICAGFETNNLAADDALVCAVLEVIEQRRIDTVYTHWRGDAHLDHQAAARATISAARHVPRLLGYRSNHYDSGETFSGCFFIDISQTIEKKIAAVKEHRSEFQRTGQKWIDYLLRQSQNDGLRVGVPYAEVFSIIKYLY